VRASTKSPDRAVGKGLSPHRTGRPCPRAPPDPKIPLEFVFHGGRAPGIDTAWVEALMLTADTAAGLHLVPEPEEPA
jgi:hypothetical protein